MLIAFKKALFELLFSRGKQSFPMPPKAEAFCGKENLGKESLGKETNRPRRETKKVLSKIK